MIPYGEVYAAVLVALRATGHKVGWSETPSGLVAGRPYAVVEIPPGAMTGETLNGPTMAEVRVRVRSVAVDPDPTAGVGGEQASQAVTWLADKLRAALHDAVLTGSTWQVSAVTHESNSGVDREGRTANMVDDYVLSVNA